ncbi:MAG: OmpA family protein [Bacteroidetes bacterium]|nr:OmpA family protein [Fibrella sp.]
MRSTLFAPIFLVFFVHLLATTPARGQQTGLATLEGTILDAETKTPVPGVLITLETIIDGRFSQTFRTGSTGRFKFLLDPKKNYYIFTAKSGYRATQEKFIISSPYTFHVSGKMILLRKGESVAAPARPAIAQAPPVTTTAEPARPVAISDTPQTQPNNEATVSSPSDTTRTGPATPATPAPPADAPVVKPAPADPVSIQSVQTQLKTVEFVQSKVELVPSAQPALDQLLTFMRERPTVRIELAGHTDNQGDFDKNLTLSKQRVDLVKTFLVANGIAADRISSRGYGSTRPVASNNSEETRRLNRRVEMIILTK